MSSNINRRKFMELSALAGSGLALSTIFSLAPKEIFAMAQQMAEKGMGMNLTPIAISEDCASLVVHLAGMNKSIRKTVTANWQEMRLGSTMRHNKKDEMELLRSCKNTLQKSPLNEFDAKKVAFTSGWIFHRAANQVLYDSDNPVIQKEKRLYHDIYLLKQYALKDDVKNEDVLSLFSLLDHRTRLRMHTFIPDQRDVDNWIPRIVSWYKNSQETAAEYARVYSSPDAAKINNYAKKNNFYVMSDPVIQLAKSIREGLANHRIDIESALLKGSSQSLYSQAVCKGVNNLKAANDYFNGKLSEAKLMNVLKLG